MKTPENLIQFHTGWIIKNVDDRELKEVNYFEIDTVPHLTNLMSSSAVYYTSDEGLTWDRANHVMTPTVFKTKDKANAMVERLYEKKMERLIASDNL